MTNEEVKRMCRLLTAFTLYRANRLSLEDLTRELKEETVLDDPMDSLEIAGLRKLRCTKCNKAIATVSLIIRPFDAVCRECA